MKISEKQIKRLYAIAYQNQVDIINVKKYIMSKYQKTEISELEMREEYDHVIEMIPQLNGLDLSRITVSKAVKPQGKQKQNISSSCYIELYNQYWIGVLTTNDQIVENKETLVQLLIVGEQRNKKVIGIIIDYTDTVTDFYYNQTWFKETKNRNKLTFINDWLIKEDLFF